MTNKNKFQFHQFDPSWLTSFVGTSSRQTQYLARYLEGLGAKTILHEPLYFDRDYLAEFAAFYSVSSKGYPNICERLHFFSESISRRTLIAGVGGSRKALQRLQDSYLGFIVKRPIPSAPLGRTVLKWATDQTPDTTPRVVNPSRRYCVHIAGIELSIAGLAWQQQDTGVGACATVSLWSMLHASAFDDIHAIPTTADITREANKRQSFGTRVFPSVGLNILQIYEAIKERDLAPLITEGDIKDASGRTIGFSKDRFASTCASFIRSGYPVMIIGKLNTQSGLSDHAICCVGFRSCVPVQTDPDTPDLADSNIEIIYIHDDNLGPNVRIKIDVDTRMIPLAFQPDKMEAKSVISLSPQAPLSSRPTIDNYGPLYPTQLIVAAHSDIRTAPDTLHKAGLRHVTNISQLINHVLDKNNQDKLGFTVSSRFLKITEYLGKELERRLNGSSKILSSVRLKLYENVGRLSLHVGVVRIGLDDATVLVDILYDTTDSDRNHPVFAHVAYNPLVAQIMDVLKQAKGTQLGVCIEAF